MVRRLIAAAILVLGLAACDSGSKPSTTPTPATKPAQTLGPVFKATPSKGLNAVRKRGYLACGVNPGLPGFAYPDVGGNWRGFDVVMGKVVASSGLFDSSEVRFIPINAAYRFYGLQ